MEGISRKTVVYKMWRANVYASDYWKCIVCSSKKRIEAHHILPVRTHPELALDENNGVTLCFSCHRLIAGKEQEVAKILTELKANRVNSVKSHTSTEGYMANTEPSQSGNRLEGVTTRNRVFRIEQFIKKQVECSWCKKMLYRHFYRVQRSKNFFCSSTCKGKWSKGKRSGKDNHMWKPVKERKCISCKEVMLPTPSSIHRDKKFCSNSCHTKYLWKIGTLKGKILDKWSKKFDQCIQCQTVEKPHYGNGLCMTCFNKSYNARNKRQ